MYYIDEHIDPATGKPVCLIRRPYEGGCIMFPPHEENSDYQQYLAWLELGNTPEEWNPDGTL